MESRPRPGIVLLLAAACLTGGGCGDARRGGAVVVRDSAGVHIVESSAPAWDEGEQWRLGAEPTVTIGVMDGPKEYQLQRLVGAVRTGEGEIIVADGGANVVRAYSDDGSHVWSLGGAGGGPGEFMRLDQLFLYEDTLYAYDLGLQRMSVIALDGRFVRSFDVAGATGFGYAEALGRFSNAEWALQRTIYARGDGASLTRGTRVFSRLAEGATTADPFASFPGDEQIVQPVGPIGAYVRRAPFARIPSALVAGDEFVYGGAARYEIAIHSPDGALRMLIRRPVEPDPISPSDLSLWQAEVEATREPYSPSLPPMYHRPISSFELPEAKAMYKRVLVDRRGNYWVGDYALPRRQSASWSVFAATGEWLGKVATPEERFQVVEIGDDYVLGIFRDEFDVEYVRVYPLMK